MLLHEENSVFRIADYVTHHGYGGAGDYGGALDRSGGLKRIYQRAVSRLANTFIGRTKFSAADAITRLQAECGEPRVLVIGAGDSVYDGGNVYYTDVAFGRHVNCICDAHDLPFPDRAFDLVIAISVLEHVVDPQRCVAEIERVLGEGGCVYAATPFLQPVYMRAHDVTRFTYLGHRRLFRCFDDLESGTVGGPGNALAHVLRNALFSLTDNRRVQSVLRLFGLLISLPLRYADHLLDRRMSSYDAAWSVFFFGRKRATPIPDREILTLYRGGCGSLNPCCSCLGMLYDRGRRESGGTVDAVDSKSTALGHGGSNPPSRTIFPFGVSKLRRRHSPTLRGRGSSLRRPRGSRSDLRCAAWSASG